MGGLWEQARWTSHKEQNRAAIRSQARARVKLDMDRTEKMRKGGIVFAAGIALLLSTVARGGYVFNFTGNVSSQMMQGFVAAGKPLVVVYFE